MRSQGDGLTPIGAPFAKFAPPAMPATNTPRPELLARIGTASRVAVLVGPPGSGKTALARQWVDHSDWSVAWMSVDLLDRAGATSFWAQVHSAFSGAGLIDDDPPDAARTLATLLDAIERGGQRIGLVIDDLSQFDDARLIDELALFVDRVGHLVHLVITARSARQLPMVRWHARQWAAEIGPAHLRFTTHEIDALATRLGVVDPVLARARARYVEGWAIGVDLELRSMTDGTNGKQLLADYLVDVMVNRADATVGRTALACSIPRLVTVDLIAALDGEASLQHVFHLERTNMFLQQVGDDGRSFRYPGHVRDVLQAELRARDPERFGDLHRRAAAHWLAVGERVEAHHHLSVVDDLDGAFEVVIAPTLELVDRGDDAGLTRWMMRLPATSDVDDPRLALDIVTAAFFARRRSDAWTWWRIAHSLAPEPSEDATTVARLHASGALLALMEADVDAAAAAVDAFDHVFGRARPVSDPIVRWLATVRTRVALARNDRSAARNGIAEIRTIGEPENIAMVTAPAMEAWLRLLEGDVEGAVELADAAWRWANKMDVQMHHGVLEATVVLGTAVLRAGDTDRAAALSGEATRQAAVLGYPWDLLRAGLLAAEVRGVVFGPHRWLTALDELATELATIDNEGTSSAYIDAQIDAARATARHAVAAHELTRSLGLEPLTDRERSLLVLLPTHLTYRQMGTELFLSVNTVKSNLKHVYAKLGVTSRAEAVSVARRAGLLDDH